MSSTLVIERKKSFMGCARKLKVLVDQQEVGAVANGKSESFSITTGPHVVAVEMGSSNCRPISINAAEGQTIKLHAALKMGMFAVSDWVLKGEDGREGDGTAGPSKHHGTMVLIFGFLGFLVGLIGLAALGQGIVDIKKMNRGEMDPSGKTMTLAGAIIGGIGFLFALSTRIAACAGG